MIRLAPEGYPFIGVSLLIPILFLLAGLNIIFLASLPIPLFMLFFFRDPERRPLETENVFIAPADGKVILVKDVYENKYLQRNSRQISIFMSPLDVHVNRSPAQGVVKKVVHNRGRFFAAYRDDASLKNENIEILLETPYGDILIRQVAGFIARRAVCRAKEGDRLKPGERFGIIKFSSRVDLYLPIETFVSVKIGQKVRAGETVVGKINNSRGV